MLNKADFLRTHTTIKILGQVKEDALHCAQEQQLPVNAKGQNKLKHPKSGRPTGASLLSETSLWAPL